MTQLKGFTLVKTLALVFKKIESGDKTKCDTFLSSSKSGIITNESHIDDVFQSIYTKITTNLQKFSGNSLGWIIDSVINHTVSISKYNPLAGSSYIKLTKEIEHPGKWLINVQNFDNKECFRWCLVRYLSSTDQNPRRIAKEVKMYQNNVVKKNMLTYYW